MTTSTNDRSAKVSRLAAILDARGAQQLQLTSTAALAWLLDGARVTVPYAGAAVCVAVVDRSGEIVVTAHSNEADRLRTEEFGENVEVRSVPWWDPLPSPADGVLDENAIADELRAARASLLPAERARYAALGAETAREVGAVLRTARPDESEHALAARLVAAVVALGGEPVVTLVAGDSRGHIPHPLPTAAPLGRRAMAVVGARRHGLIVNLTRWISFGAKPVAAEAALREVEADAYAATVSGRPLKDVLAEIAASYRRHGLGASAWLAHHQGGPTGYLGRDPKAAPTTTDQVAEGQAFAWNPWVPGAKCEDTMIVTSDGPQVLSADPGWPVVEVRGLPRPLTLELE